jgi:NADPH:quinone reductase
MVLGWDVAGTVVATGAEVTGWQVGDRAAAMVFQPKDQRGTYAERINLDAGLLSWVPAELSLEQAATVPLAGLTAVQLLELVHIGDVRTLLVNGPLGAVGRAVLALAVNAGIEVVGVARAEQADRLSTLGATLAVERGDYADRVRRHYPNGVDAAIDLVGGAAAHTAFGLVRDGGRYVTSVPPYIDPDGPFDTARGIPVQLLVVAPNPTQLTELLGQAAAGTLDTTIEATYPLEQAAEAHQRQAAGRLNGRVVLIP